MSETINAKGLACPEPVILAKKALETSNEITVLVDNATAVENIKRLAAGAGCSVEVARESGGIFRVDLKKEGGRATDEAAPDYLSCPADVSLPAFGPTVFVIAADTMGKGSDELGVTLMKAFIHTATELKAGPDVMIFYNSGAKLAAEGSDFLDDLKKLEDKGVKMLVCGTCVNYYNLTGKIAAGEVSNMYDIAVTLSGAGRIVQP
ncbi:MAG TPA: sulfurtransferase-like selenium metabolism protein YedF [Syntrophorhabdaceae bacterium]|nr:sulfurtransferase-like selenium metabolism protein YedF [Syntrophorhabdaceae bacterium]